MSKIRLVLADDHGLLRAGIARLIEDQPDLEVVAQAASADEAIEAVVRSQPDVLVLDLSMPGGNGMQTIATLRKRAPQTKVLVLTMHNNPAYVRATLGAGCSGYVVKTVSDEEMLAAVRSVARGRTAINLSLSDSEMQAMFGSVGQYATTGPQAALSDREREVLQWLARGYTSQQIADKIFLSVKTVETYRTRIRDKLGIKDRAELITYALHTGLLREDDGES